jgi:hypothetical protein
MKMLNEDTIKTVEFWKDIVGYEGYYQISTFGRVRSLGRQSYNPNGSKNKYVEPRVMNQPLRSKDSGYPYVCLYKNSKGIKHSTHIIMKNSFPCWFSKYNGSMIDHKDRNKTNNHITNLRLSTWSQNNINMAKQKNSKNKYKGVHKSINRYRARIEHKGVKYNIGYYLTPEDAARAYDKKAIEIFGEFAFQNFPEDTVLV